jgi:hypothetical protein
MNESGFWGNFRQKYLTGAIALSLFLPACFIFNLTFLFKHDIPFGVDGFYYIIQIKNFLGEGVFYYPTYTPAVLYMAVGISSLGIEPAAAMKILSALLYIVLILAVYLIIKRATDDRWLGFIGALIVEASVLRLSWIIEFVSNLGGITFLFCAIYCLRRKNKNRIWRLAGFCFLIVAVISHKAILPLILLILTVYGAFILLGKFYGSPFFWIFLILLILTGEFYPLILAAISAKGIFPFLSENISVNPGFPLFIKGFFEEKFILCILSPAAFFVSLRKLKSDKNLASVNGAIAFLTIFITLNPFLNHTENIMTIPDRLVILMHLQIAFLLTFTMRLLVLDKTYKLVLTAAVLVLLLIGNNNAKERYEAFLTRRQNLVTNLAKFKDTISKESVIIAPHGYQFLLTSILDVPSQRLLPEENARIYWLVFGVSCDKLEKKSLIILVEGKTCTAILENGDIKPLSMEEKTHLLNSNPHIQRISEELQQKLIPVE